MQSAKSSRFKQACLRNNVSDVEQISLLKALIRLPSDEESQVEKILSGMSDPEKLDFLYAWLDVNVSDDELDRMLSALDEVLAEKPPASRPIRLDEVPPAPMELVSNEGLFDEPSVYAAYVVPADFWAKLSLLELDKQVEAPEGAPKIEEDSVLASHTGTVIVTRDDPGPKSYQLSLEIVNSSAGPYLDAYLIGQDGQGGQTISSAVPTKLLSALNFSEPGGSTIHITLQREDECPF